MTDDRIREAFRTGLRPFTENPPAGPSFDDLTAAVLIPSSRKPSSSLRTLFAGIAAVLIVGGATLALLQSRDTASFDPGAAAETGDRFWAAVATGDTTAIAETTHPDASLNLDGLAELAASRGGPLDINVARDVFGQASSPRLCYLLAGPRGEARGSIVFKQNGSDWLVYEIHTNTTMCTLASPSTTTTQPPPEFRLGGLNGFIQSRLPDAFDERPGEIAVVAMVPAGSIAEVTAVVDTLEEVEATVSIPANRVRQLADEWVQGTRMVLLEGEWVAVGLVPVYTDTNTDEWLLRLREVSGVHAEWVDHALAKTRVPSKWAEVTEIPFLFGVLDVSRVATEQGIVVITADNKTLLVGYDGGWRLGEPAPQRVPSAPMIDAYEAAVGDLVVYVSYATLVLDIETLTWTEVPRPPVERVLGSAVIDGELYLVGRGQQPVLLVFDPARMSWRELESVPAFINVGDVITDGAHLFVAGVRQGSRNEIIGDRSPVVFRFEPGAGWTQLPSIPIDGQAPGIGWADGAGLVGWNYDHQAALFSEGSWQRISDHPSHCESYPRAQTIRGGMYGFLCEPLILDSSTLEWTVIEAPEGLFSIAPDGTALYALVPNRDSTLLLSYNLNR